MKGLPIAPRFQRPRTALPAIAFVFTAGAISAAPALAQSDPSADTGAAPVIVIATRTGEGDASATTTLTDSDIRRLQAPTLLESLNDLAGVRAVSTGGVGGGSFVSIRGGEPNFTLVLLDGIRVNDTTNTKGGGFDFGLIDPSLVAAVAVDRGAGSAVHGSDALSGTIDIRLLEPRPGATTIAANLHGGTDGELGGGASLRHGWSGGGLIVAGSLYDSNHADDSSSLSRAQGLARIRQRLGSYDLVALGTYAHSRHAIFPEDSGGPLLAVNRDREHGTADLWTAALSLRHIQQGMLRPHLSISYSDQRSDVDTPAIAPGVLDGVPAIASNNRLSRYEVTGDVLIDAGSLVATLGGSILGETGRSRGTIDFGFPIPADFRLHRTTASGFAEATFTPDDRFTLNAAARYDSVSSGEDALTGRADIAFRPVAAGPALYARIGSGFKLPSFYALGNPLVGNPALKPERSRNLEAGIRWTWGADNRVRLAWFDNRFTNLVDFDPVLFRTVNRAHVAARGGEIEANVRIIPAVNLSGALAYLSIDSETPLRDRPRWQGNVGARWQFSQALSLGGTLRFNGDYLDSSIPTGLIRTDGHAEADLDLHYRIARQVRLDLAFRNIGDSRSWEAVGFPMQGRRLMIRIATEL